MKFRTEIRIDKSDLKLGIERPVVLAGSCFADNIGARMRSCLWNARNPLGVLFNPLSIAKVLELALLEADSTGKFADSIFKVGPQYHSWMLDSSFSGTEDSIREKISHAQGQLRSILGKGQLLIVTFGTAYCYFLSSRPDYVVANCHKQPSSIFLRRRVGDTEITEKWCQLLRKLKMSYPDLDVIFTVSPVRHVRDGLHENQLSKATLHLAVDALCREFDYCSYFPAYEIVNDDLRDYRFYADDLVHPSSMAIDYIWDKFLDCYVSDSGRMEIEEGEKIVKRLRHRPLIADGAEALTFAESSRELYGKFLKSHPAALNLTDLDPQSDAEILTI